MQKTCLIIGATSAIAGEVAKCYAAKGATLLLVGRDQEKLKTLAKDLEVRYQVSVKTFVGDMNSITDIERNFSEIQALHCPIDMVLIAHGNLPDQIACQQSWTPTLEALQLNLLSYIQWLTLLANFFEQQGHGSIVAIGSCAGDRGRRSNYVYGTAKAAIAFFMQGLRHRLSRKNIHVLTVKPGFVDTPMTAHFPKGLLWAKPDKVAQSILKAIDRKRAVIYTPGFWFWIMTIIKYLPNKLFNRMDL